jgi:hypothetical protein
LTTFTPTGCETEDEKGSIKDENFFDFDGGGFLPVLWVARRRVRVI